MHEELKAIADATRYAVDAFLFVQRGLDFTVKNIHGDYTTVEEPDPVEDVIDEGDAFDPADSDELDLDAAPVSRHVSGQQLCLGLRDFAIEQYGLLARTVLRSWGVTRCDDFGHIVFAMVDGGLMQKTDQDELEDFADVYDFNDAFASELQLSENV